MSINGFGFQNRSGSLSGQSNGTKQSFKKSVFDKAIIGADYMNEHVRWAKEVINTSPDNLFLSKNEDDGGAILVR